MVFAQGKGGGSTGSTTGPATGPSTGNNTNSPINNTNNSPLNPNTIQNNTTQNPIPPITRPIFISGKVVLEDGTPPPTTVTILRVCNGIERAMGYTDSKGNFSFDLTHSTAAFQDASTPGSTRFDDPTRASIGMDDPMYQMNRASGTSRTAMDSGDTALIGCELRARLAGYRSGTIDLAMHRSMDNPDVGQIILHRIGKDEGTVVSMTSMMAPKDAKKAFEKAQEALKKKKVEEAQKELQKAVAIYPKYADAWTRLGSLQNQNKDYAGARESFQKAIEADPKLAPPYVEMAILEAREGKWKECADYSGRAIRLDPFDYPVAFYFDALANYNLQNWDVAEKSARQLQKLDPNHRFPLGTRILGSVLAQKKDYPGAAQQMRNYLSFAGNAKDADEVRGQLKELESITNGTPQQEPPQKDQ
jgi:tetratricopeptide (TPR) repeat protein